MKLQLFARERSPKKRSQNLSSFEAHFWVLLGSFGARSGAHSAHSLRVPLLPYSKPLENAKKNHQNDEKSIFVSSLHFHPKCSVIPPKTSCTLCRPLEYSVHHPTAYTLTCCLTEPDTRCSRVDLTISRGQGRVIPRL